MLKAFITEWEGIEGIYWDQSASKVRYRTYLDAKDAGYELLLIEINVKRAKEYDSPKYEPQKNGIDLCSVYQYKNNFLDGANAN